MNNDDWTEITGIIDPSEEVENILNSLDDSLDGILPRHIEPTLDTIYLDAFDSEALIGIQRHRIATDSAGITTLVGFHRCPLSCSYCLNPQCNIENGFSRWITPQTLFD